ncbi:MAG: DUF1835 domain-containing protein [Bauldia sp.]
MADLIITNGDSAGYSLRDAGKAGVILPWRDVLHEGPIVAGPIEACSAERVAYLVRRFRIPTDQIVTEFAERDTIMRSHADFDRIELWFEHDLYDQLQLIQILTFLADVNRSEGVVLVQADDFLGAQRADTILRFAERQRAAAADDLALGAELWSTLAEATPKAIAARVEGLDGRLPFARPVLIRFLEELPSPDNGLSRTEQAILAGIDRGTANPVRLFPEVIAGEEAAFMGDSSFFHILDDLASSDVPLIAGLAPAFDGEGDSERFREAELELTIAGDDVLAGEADHVAMSGLDRWWAGTRLLGRDVWRYDRDALALHPPVGQGELGF